MDFGTLIFTKPDRVARDVAWAEANGFSHAWIPDSHMIWGDVWACMALAAAGSKTIKLGTGVAVASSRIPPVTVDAIASINQIAPGRVILGYGTGHTGRRVMGLEPVRQSEFREQVRVIRELLDTGETTYSTEGVTRQIRFLHRDRIPFYVAANGPKTLELAGEYGDGAITTGIMEPARIAAVRASIEAGARRAGRKLREFPIVSLTHACVLEPGEDLDSPRVKLMTGHWVMASFHAIAAGYATARYLPASVQTVYAEYEDYVRRMAEAPEDRYLELHVGHCTFVAPAEWRFVTAEAIAATTLIGTADDVAGRIEALDRGGLSQIFINPPMDAYHASIEEVGRVIARMR